MVANWRKGVGMGEFAKAVRWSAPGSVFLLIASATFVAAIAVARQPWTPFGDNASQHPTIDSAGVALLVFGAVPIGFVIYQIYYFAYSSPRGLVMSFVHMDVALAVQSSGSGID